MTNIFTEETRQEYIEEQRKRGRERDTVQHVYTNIYGFFNFHRLYRRMVQNAEDGSLFVEVGCFFGRSTGFLAACIINKKKSIRLHAIDIWPEIKVGEKYYEESGIGRFNGSMYDMFLVNMGPLLSVIEPKRKGSLEAAKDYEDETIDFLFLDNNHLYEHVIKELEEWYPTVKTGGIIAGHDYHSRRHRGVKKGVDEFFGAANLTFTGTSSWMVEK